MLNIYFAIAHLVLVDEYENMVIVTGFTIHIWKLIHSLVLTHGSRVCGILRDKDGF